MVDKVSDADRRKLYAVEFPDSPAGRDFFALEALDRIRREKEALERRANEDEKRLSKLEQFASKFSGIDDATLTWLAKADEMKLKRVDGAIQLLDNLEFAGKWGRRGFLAFVATVATVAGAITWVKSNWPFQR